MGHLSGCMLLESPGAGWPSPASAAHGLGADMLGRVWPSCESSGLPPASAVICIQLRGTFLLLELHTLRPRCQWFISPVGRTILARRVAATSKANRSGLALVRNAGMHHRVPNHQGAPIVSI
ncbi:hypothetical protein MN608_06517 [Microdochium nivale]|nr:hypothetical protein MN608_06517 [Microdochium nivale]